LIIYDLNKVRLDESQGQLMASAPSAVTPSGGSSNDGSQSAATIKKLTTTAQLHAHLAALTARESELTTALNDLVSNRDTLDDAIDRLQGLVPLVQEIAVEVDGRPANPSIIAPYSAWQHGGEPDSSGFELAIGEEGLVDRVARVWETSERVGGKVRKLDTEVSRVREAAERVTAVLELKVR
jgi:hypothetical protein